MDVIREHLMYKNSPLNICMAKIHSHEQYEVIRIILESKTQDITICKHEATNQYIDILLQKLNISLKECSNILNADRKIDFHL
jgi:hypothetical protein